MCSIGLDFGGVHFLKGFLNIKISPKVFYKNIIQYFNVFSKNFTINTSKKSENKNAWFDFIVKPRVM